jgi:hypothetical protein
MSEKKKDCGCGFGKKLSKRTEFGKNSPKRSVPTDKKLYAEIKRKVKRSVKTWPSAYASGQLVQQYKRAGGRYRMGDKKFYKPGSENALFLTPGIRQCLSIIYGPAITIERSRFGNRSGLTRWFKEKWVNVCAPKKKGKYVPCARAGAKKYPYCRPLIRVTRKTPRTVKEIPKSRLKKLCKMKSKKRSERMPSNRFGFVL